MPIVENVPTWLEQVVPDYGSVLEQLPHPILLLTPGLQILMVNAAGRRLLGKPATALIGVRLPDVLTPAGPPENQWQTRLLASYDQICNRHQSITVPVTLFLQAPTANTNKAAPRDSGQILSTSAPDYADTVMWHVSHGPIFDAAGKLFAIATHVIVLGEVEPAVARVAGFAMAQLLPAGSLHEAPMDTPIGAGKRDTAWKISEPVKEFDIVDTPGLPSADRKMSILMVEDNQDLRSSTAELLQFLGHRVVSVTDAELALRQLEATAFDILFTDLTLPKMSGAELARHVLLHYRPTRVIITSGYGREMANAQNLDAVFLPKPYRVADLEEVLAKVPVGRA